MNKILIVAMFTWVSCSQAMLRAKMIKAASATVLGGGAFIGIKKSFSTGNLPDSAAKIQDPKVREQYKKELADQNTPKKSDR